MSQGNDKMLSVTRLLRKMRNLLEIDIGEVWVEGEISNVRKQSSGHVYFSIKDEGGQLSCVLFRSVAKQFSDIIRDGKMVQIFGEVSVYEQRGSLQLIVKKVKAGGAGILQEKFELLKRKLQEEGLFDLAHKKDLPNFPNSIGFITSPSGAALQDMLNILARRAPWVNPYLIGVQVQGADAEKEIAAAIEKWGNWGENGLPEVDVLIIGRGGGSLEDLWNFNEEIVARAIAKCSLPIISGIGHEIDFTIADFVADMRAPTPSAAVELAVPNKETLLNKLEVSKRRIDQRVKNKLETFTLQLELLKRSSLFLSPEKILRDFNQRLSLAKQELEEVAEKVLVRKRHEVSMKKQVHALKSPEQVLKQKQIDVRALRALLITRLRKSMEDRNSYLKTLTERLRLLSVESALERGYSLTFNDEGDLLKTGADLESGARIKTQLAYGEIHSIIK